MRCGDTFPWAARALAGNVAPMYPVAKVVLAAVLAALLVRYAGRLGLMRAFFAYSADDKVPVIHPASHAENAESFDSRIAPGAPL